MKDLPKSQFYVRVLGGGRGVYRSRPYQTEDKARATLDFYRKRGVECTLYRTDTDWQLVDSLPAQEETLF